MKNSRDLLLALFVSTISAALALPTASLGAHALPSRDFEAIGASSVGVNIQISGGTVFGTSSELVYTGASGGGTRNLSELLWDIEGVYTIGGVVSVNAPQLHNSRINFGLWIPVTEGKGTMTDYDWMVERDDWTDRSIGANNINSGYMIDFNIALPLYETGGLSCSWLLGFKYDFWDFSDLGGSYVYSTAPTATGSAGFRDNIGTFPNQPGITYEQTFVIPYVGAMLEGSAGPVQLTGYFMFSSLTTASDKDHHIARGLHFEEEFEGGTYVAAGASVTYDVHERAFVTGAVDYQSVHETVGDMTIIETGQSTSGSAGIAHSSTMITVAAGWRI